jgi:hypothetical protein
MRISGLLPLTLPVLFLALQGCGKQESPSAEAPARAPATQRASAQPPATTLSAAAKDAPVNANPLTGIWIRITDGDLDGLELTADGKATLRSVTGGFDGAEGPLDATYTFIDGRLSFVAASGRTLSYDATLADDRLELKGTFEFTDSGFQRFQRAKPGQTYAQAAQEQARARAQAVQDRIDAVDRFLAQPGMVLFIATTPPKRIALDLEHPRGNAFSGEGWHDDTPPHLDVITGQIVQGDASPDALRIRLQLGEQLQPPPPSKTGGREVTLDVSIQSNQVHAAGKLLQGNNSVDVSIMQDVAAHDEIRQRTNLAISRIADQRGRQIENHQRLLRSLAEGAPVVGIMRVSLIGVIRMPISLVLSPAPDGSFTGAAKFPILDASAAFQAKIVEPASSVPYLELQFKEFENGTPASIALAAQLRKRPWWIGVSDGEKVFKFGPAGEGAAADLAVASDGWKSDQQKALIESLSAGVSFRVRFPERTNVPQTFIRLKIDAARRNVSGMIVSGGEQIDAHAGATISGILKEQDGMLFIPAQITEPEIPGRARTVFQTDMYVCHEPAGWTIISPMFPPNQPRARKTLEMVEIKDDGL